MTQKDAAAMFCLMQSGEPMKNDKGEIHLFTPKVAHEMLIDDRIPNWWWVKREFRRWPNELRRFDEEHESDGGRNAV